MKGQYVHKPTNNLAVMCHKTQRNPTHLYNKHYALHTHTHRCIRACMHVNTHPSTLVCLQSSITYHQLLTEYCLVSNLCRLYSHPTSRFLKVLCTNYRIFKSICVHTHTQIYIYTCANYSRYLLHNGIYIYIYIYIHTLFSGI